MDNGLGSGAAPKGMYDHLKQDARVADAKDPRRLLSERHGHGFDHCHVGTRRTGHDEFIIATGDGGDKPMRQMLSMLRRTVEPIV